MRWLIDSDILIEGERQHPDFVSWQESADEVATADVIRWESLLGVHAVPDAAKRQRGEQFYRDYIAKLPSFPCEPSLRFRRTGLRESLRDEDPARSAGIPKLEIHHTPERGRLCRLVV